MIGDYLQEFRVIVDEGTITAAATRLGMSQATLARHLSTLECQLDAHLLERSSSGIRLTIDGSYAYDAALDLRELSDRLERTTRDLGGRR
ncbi:LysR family transcriptional regulator [bacterium]|nr:LysR family transcriptional regulator [bacterium]